MQIVTKKFLFYPDFNTAVFSTLLYYLNKSFATVEDLLQYTFPN